MKCNITALCCKQPATIHWIHTSNWRSGLQQKQRLHKRVESVIFSLSNSHKHTHSHSRDGYSLCTCAWSDLRKEKTHSISSLTFSSCHGAKTPSALKPERNVAQLSLSLSLKPLSYISRPLFTSQCCYRNGCLCFALYASLPLPLLSLCSHSPPPFPPSLCDSTTAKPPPLPPSLSYVHLIHHKSEDETEFGNFVSFKREKREEKKCKRRSSGEAEVHIYLAIKLPSNLLCEHSSLSSAHWVYFGATSTTVKLSWRHV